MPVIQLLLAFNLFYNTADFFCWSNGLWPLKLRIKLLYETIKKHNTSIFVAADHTRSS